MTPLRSKSIWGYVSAFPPTITLSFLDPGIAECAAGCGMIAHKPLIDLDMPMEVGGCTAFKSVSDGRRYVVDYAVNGTGLHTATGRIHISASLPVGAEEPKVTVNGATAATTQSMAYGKSRLLPAMPGGREKSFLLPDIATRFAPAGTEM